MAEIKEFVVNDRRKFTSEGELRPDAPPSEPKPARPETLLKPVAEDKYESSAHLVETKKPAPEASATNAAESGEPEPPPPLTPEQIAEVKSLYDATVERIDAAIRAGNPGMEPVPEMSFERVLHSLYLQAILQLGGAAEPGQKPQVDVLGARQTIDMLAILADKTSGNLSQPESLLMENALFELRMGFFDVTQAIAMQAQARQAAPGTPPPGPSIVR